LYTAILTCCFKPIIENIVAHGLEFPRSHQNLFVYAHKQNSNIIFCYPSSKQSCKSIKAIQWFAFCWLLAGLINHPAQRGLSACSGRVISFAGCAAQAISLH